MSRFKSSESVIFIVGLVIIAQAVHKSHVNPEYDPLAQISMGLAIMTGGWVAPTDKLDQAVGVRLPDVNLTEKKQVEEEDAS